MTERLLVKRTTGSGPVPNAVSPQVAQQPRSTGRPLQDSTRAAMEERFGIDLGRVRVHEEDAAGAYAVGSELVFGRGRYRPETQAGRALLAHELVHVVQQARGGEGGERAERRAREAGERAARGDTVADQDLGGAPVTIQRADPDEEAKQAAEPAAAGSRTHSLDGFGRDSSELLDKHRESIDQLAWSVALHLGLLSAATVSIAIIGHTDTTGSDKHNTALGLRRAEAAKAALEAALRKNAVSDSQIEWIVPVSMGERQLAVPTKNEVDNPANRRVTFEVTITPQPAPPPAPTPAPAPAPAPPVFVPPPGPLAPTREALEPKVPGRVPSVPKPSREWIENALKSDELLRQLPGALREKAIDALKNVDETGAEKALDLLPWDDKAKEAAKAAVKTVLERLKGREWTPPPEPPRRQPDWGPERSLPPVPGEKIFKLPQIKFKWP
jgi:outer membrane protein OmpA-like peptidoglycan-associated protein